MKCCLATDWNLLAIQYEAYTLQPMRCTSDGALGTDDFFHLNGYVFKFVRLADTLPNSQYELAVTCLFSADKRSGMDNP